MSSVCVSGRRAQAQAAAGAKVPLVVTLTYVDVQTGSKREGWRNTFMVDAAVVARLRMRT
ncbi:MAG TPA: hypothetical protein VL049_05025 [Candidatus Dormibacteraeota bacterium]|nr:hypothetical protein [Candidatus Dormibacteraeota bacterium]